MKMTEKNKKPAVKSAGIPFQKGFDPRRWLGGRGKKSASQREGEKILLAVIWDELSKLYGDDGKPLELDAETDALRLMVRRMIEKQPRDIVERIAGKVSAPVDVTTDGEKLQNKITLIVERASEAIKTLDENESDAAGN